MSEELPNQVRRASAEDIPAIASLLDQVVAETPGHRGGHLFRHVSRSVGVSAERFVEALTSPSSAVFVSDGPDGRIVGFTLVRSAGPLGLIEELHGPVEADVALLEAASEWCVEQGCAEIDIEVLPGDRASKSLCEGAGFKARSLTMHRSLAVEPSHPPSYRGSSADARKRACSDN